MGGWCRSIEENGFTFDYAGHIMFSNDALRAPALQMLLGDNVHWQDREAWIYSKNVYTRYPFQGALYGLPPQVIKECIVGAIEARFGALASPKAAAGSNGHANGKNGKTARTSEAHCGDVKDCCADGILESSAPCRNPRARTAAAASRAISKSSSTRSGAPGSRSTSPFPTTASSGQCRLSEMETSWLGGRVPLPDLEEMIEGALSPVAKPMGPNARFGYPLRGGFQALMDGWLPHRQRQTPPEQPGGASLAAGAQGDAQRRRGNLLRPSRQHHAAAGPDSTDGGTGARIRPRRSGGLRHVSVRCVHLGVGRENLTEKHWIYYPEDTVFHRIFVQGNASPHCNPPGGFGLTCEITYSEHKPLPCDGEALIRRCISDCHKVGLFRPEDPIWAAIQCDMPYAYVVYDHGRTKAVSAIREWLGEHDILLAGRYSEWEYYNSDHAFLAGKKAAEEVRRRQDVLPDVMVAGWQMARQDAQG